MTPPSGTRYIAPEMLRLTDLNLPLHHADEALPAAIVGRLRATPRGALSAAVDGIKVVEAVAKSLCRAA